MQKTMIQLPEMRLIGITCRTNNARLFEANPKTNPVAMTVQRYFHEGLPEKIAHRHNPGVTYCVYTQYESDLSGDFTYFIGEQVDSFEPISSEFETLTIPAQEYAKLTHGPGPMPSVCIDLWKHIWMLSPAELGGERSYIADFEVYDERSRDHQQVTLDIYIGVK